MSRPVLTARGATVRLLLALVGFGVVAATIVLAVEWERGSRLAVAAAQESLDTRSTDVAERLEANIRARIRAVRVWARLDVAREIAVDDVDKRLAATLRELVQDLGADETALALDRTGRIVAASDSSVIGARGTARFRGLDGLPAIGTVHDEAGAPWLAAAAAVPDHANRPIGRLVLLVPWERLVAVGVTSATLARTRVDGPGGVLFRGGAVPEAGVGETLGADPRFVVGLAERAPLPELPLRVTHVQSRDEVLAPVRAARRTALLAAAAVLLVLIPAALLLTRTASRTFARQEALATMGTMAAGLAHEIRSPLGVIGTSLELLTRAEPSSDRRAELAGIVREETDRLERLVDDLLAFARPRDPQRNAGDLAVVVGMARALLESLAARHGAVLAFDLAPAPVRVDAEQVRQVLLNLVDNAARAAGTGGRVVVSTRTVDGGGELAVRDNGPGVPPEFRDTLWDPFVTSRASGTGLGLAIVRRIVEAHGGSAELYSAPGTGATFRLGFPAG